MAHLESPRPTASRPSRTTRLRHARWLYPFLRVVLGYLLNLKYRIRAHGTDVFRSIRPPYIVLGNHTNVWDPFLVNASVPEPIHYIVSDTQFRSRIVRFGLGLVGSIPKTKAVSDLETVKKIIQVKNEPGVIGIFPEGQSSWDGRTLPLVYSTAKLIKSLKQDVIVCRSNGAFLSRPRWSRDGRRGELHLYFTHLFRGSELKTLSVEEVFTRIRDALHHNEGEWQRRNRRPYLGRRRAEYLEEALYWCPACGAFSSLRSNRAHLSCGRCGYTVRYTLHGDLRREGPGPDPGTLQEWSDRQQEALAQRIGGATSGVAAGDPDAGLFPEEPVELRIGRRRGALKRAGLYALTMDSEGLLLRAADGTGERIIPLSAMDGFNVQHHERIEFFVGPRLYQLRFPKRRHNARKYLDAYNILRERGLDGGESNQLLSALP